MCTETTSTNDIQFDPCAESYQSSIDEAERIRKIWRKSAIIWLIFDYAINILAFSASIATICAEVFILEDNTLSVILFSIVAATLTFIGFAVKPKSHAQKYRKAFVKLDSAKNNYTFFPSAANYNRVCEAIDEGEKAINGTFDIE